MNFVEGDAVQLKSGGPTMTVDELNWQGDGKVRVLWFSENEVIRYETFKVSQLVKVQMTPTG
ncbi:MAG: DUF2158 domain-containing protein [Terracidiphilus sp.]